jgi:uncharacterized protein with HEPN domain
MVEAAQKVIRYTADREAESFAADEMTYDATLRNLEIIRTDVPELLIRLEQIERELQ